MAKIITFYSYKGGVGRSMCLANAGVLLCKWNYKVLVVDWDLEAPGLENFYANSKYGTIDVSIKKGVIDILQDLSTFTEKYTPDIPFIENWPDYFHVISVPDARGCLHLTSSGKRDESYYDKVREFDVKNFYQEKKGSVGIERLRNFWKEKYDFVLIDSRTGITDIGGICTIQLPDILVLLFTATEQGFRGIGNVAEKVLTSQKELSLERLNLLLFPVLSRVDGSEKKLTKEWVGKFIDGEKFPISMSTIFRPWLPSEIDRKSFVRQTLIPYVPYYSFGEGLPVEEEGFSSDIQGMGYAYESITAVLATQLNYPNLLIENRSKLLKLANKTVLEKRFQHIDNVVSTELQKLRFGERIAEKITASDLLSTQEGKADTIIKQIIYQVIQELLPEKGTKPGFSDHLEINSKDIGEGVEEWEEENPLDKLTDHIALIIFFQLKEKESDSDFLVAAKDYIAKSIDNASKLILPVKNARGIAQYEYLNTEKWPGQVKEILDQNLHFFVFEITRTLTDKVLFCINNPTAKKPVDYSNIPANEDYPPIDTVRKTKPNFSKLVVIAGVVILAIFIATYFLSGTRKSGIDPTLQIDSLEKQLEISRYEDSASISLNKGDTSSAENFYDKIDSLSVPKDRNEQFSALKKRVKALSGDQFSKYDAELNKLSMAIYQKPILKIDIFCVDKVYEEESSNRKKFQNMYSSELADSLLSILEQEPNFVVRKRLLGAIKKTSIYSAATNEIRYDVKSEYSAAEMVREKIQADMQLKLVSFTLKALPERTRSNYISIFLKNKD